MHRYRSHSCGDLREADIRKDVRLSGWCHRIRDHGGSSSSTCATITASRGWWPIRTTAFKQAEKLQRNGSCASTARCAARPAGTDNPDLPTGAVEVYVGEIEVLGPAGELPIQVFGEQESPEDLRLKYRFLDLRRERLHRNIMMRGAVIDSIRRRMK
jgi:aspartyl-tRNA synthetase